MNEAKQLARRRFSPRQSRAGRALLDWSQEDLARRAGLELEAVELYEGGAGDLGSEERDALGRVLHAAGVVAVEAHFAGEGVRFAKPSVSVDVG